MRSTIATYGKKIVSVAAACAGAFLYSLPAHAQVDTGLGFATAIGLGTADIRTTIARIISYFLGLLGIIAVCIVLYAGFLWMTAGGNEEKVTAAKKWLVNGVIGLVIILSAFTITQFVMRAIESGSGGLGGPGGGPGGGGGIGGGSSGTFRAAGIAPGGAGPSDGGWPKNYAITVGFTAEVKKESVTDISLTVKKCNARVNNKGEAQEFDFQMFNSGQCQLVAGTRATDGNRVVFQPSATPIVEPTDAATDFEGDFWYVVKLLDGQIQDKDGHSLSCRLFSNDDISGPSVSGDLCDRAVAFNKTRDVQPPTAVVNAPSGASCIPAEIQAKGLDDVLVSRIDLKLDGGTANLSSSSAVNGGLTKEFTIGPVIIDYTKLERSTIAGIVEHVISATAYDGLPQPNVAPAESRFSIKPTSCCNAPTPADPGETGPNCGVASGCGACVGDTCTIGSGCSSGVCQNGRCVERPEITGVDHDNVGPGTLVTIKGKFFGTAPGTVVFMGQPDAPAPAPSDDKVAAACAVGAWHEIGVGTGVFEVTVAVPEGAVNGPIKLLTADGASDTTEAETPLEYELNPFRVTTTTLPGICVLTPSTDSVGKEFIVKGTGFGDTMQPPNQPPSKVSMGTSDVSISLGGWGATAINAAVPPLSEGAYQVKVRVNDVDSNKVTFAIKPPAGQEKPVITAIVPDDVPPGSYVTIQGKGFGSGGTVKLFFGSGSTQDVAIGDAPACSDFWHNNYIVIKVPKSYQTNPDQGIARDVHKVQVFTANPPQTSNQVDFKVGTGPSRPGICSISPASGPPGVAVTVTGEGFGTADPAVDTSVGPKSCLANGVCNILEFFESAAVRMPSKTYSNWKPGSIGALVPGSTADKASWPKTGPVRVTAERQASSNSIPFMVANCKETGGDSFCRDTSGDPEMVCCPTGACDLQCSPNRESAFGWRFSTNVLPSLPIVIEQASCSGTQGQSPSPYKNSQDACSNAKVKVIFNVEMDASTFITTLNAPAPSDTVKIEDCGIEDAAKCPQVPVLVKFARNFTGGGKVLYMEPLLVPKKWYRVTIVSTATAGVKDKVGRTLDGNYDDIAGGNYSYVFRVREGDQACALDAVSIDLPEYTIDHKDGDESILNEDEPSRTGFFADLRAANCNSLTCHVGGVDKYTVEWKLPANPSVLTRFTSHFTPPTVSLPDEPPPSSDCAAQYQPITAEAETTTNGEKLVATADTSGTSSGEKTGESTVKVKFADPVVVDYAPKCTEACVNAEVSAEFNVPMTGTTISTNTVEMFKCRNASCNPPFETVDPSSGVSARTVDGVLKGVVIAHTTDFTPNSFYLVRLKGGPSGIKSESGVSLTGLNDGDFFTWTFRTKDSSTPCAPSKAVMEPKEAELPYADSNASSAPRLPFRVTPFGAPDACNPKGQALNGDTYDWGWSKLPTPGGVIAGFLPGALTALQNDDDTRINTKPGLTKGCTERCVNAGSQNTQPQCGNGGALEVGEDCEKADFPTKCNLETCLWTGVSGSCGNGTREPGEQCDSVPGCDATCHLLGSALGNSICGDRFVGDGEGCDDGNASNFDGCSSQCLREGTLPTCEGAAVGKKCVNFCGNGLNEDGEDPGCDLGPNDPNGRVSAKCDQQTCLKKGTSACVAVNGVMPNGCCGNGRIEDGEKCDAINGVLPDGCTANCLLAGSSYAYRIPSYCRDSKVGDGDPLNGAEGEDNRCEVGVGTDAKVDPFQAIVGGSPNPTSQTKVCSNDRTITCVNDAACGANNLCIDVTAAQSFEGTVIATVGGIATGNEGKAKVTLARPCGHGDPNACAAIGAALTPPRFDLTCMPDGSCAVAPTGEMVYPKNGANDVCRNTVVRVEFTAPMNVASVQKHMMVGEAITGSNCGKICVGGANPGTDCTANDNICTGTGAQCGVRPVVAVAGVPAHGSVTPADGFAARLWKGVVSFFYRLFGADADAASFPVPSPAPTYCLVPGTIDVVGKMATWSPKSALKPTAWYSVLIEGNTDLTKTDAAAKTALGVEVMVDRTFNFMTGPEICKIDSVSIAPGSHLFTTAEDLGPSSAPGDTIDGDHAFTARAHPTGKSPDAEIATTEEYAFKWKWTPQPALSPIIVVPTNAPVSTTNGWCEDGEYALTGLPCNGRSCDCAVALSKAAQPRPLSGCGNEICETSSETASAETVASCLLQKDCKADVAELGTATVKVRTGGTFPQNGEAVVQVTADISERRVLKSHITASSNVVVLICNTPWPARRVCPTSGTKLTLPWDSDPDPALCASLAKDDPVWRPFYDKGSDIGFYYCRDGQKAGAESDDLPALNESVVTITPGGGVLKEFLLTYPSSTTQLWRSDAIGFRIMSNNTHVGIRDWYADRGFRGSPSDTKVDGYDGLREGRTNYVNAAARIGQSLYTNVNILSYSEGAQPETIAIVNRILGTVDMNRSVKDLKYCVNKDDGNPVVLGTCADTAAKSCVNSSECAQNVQCQPVTGQGAATLGCDDDRDCRVGADGKFITSRDKYVCLATKTKLVRDVLRWQDLQSMRNTLLRNKSRIPTAEAGSFLRARTSSLWPSWNAILASVLGSAPTDPVNAYMECTGDAGYDPATCWNAKDRRYQCPKDSHVYEYQSVGGQDFKLRADFEVVCGQYASRSACLKDPNGFCGWIVGINAPSSCEPSMHWKGGTCIERPESGCSGECVFNQQTGTCGYKEGNLEIGGLVPISPNCQGTTISSESGVCGDGVLQPNTNPNLPEQCEPNSPPKVESCVVTYVCEKDRSITCGEAGQTPAPNDIRCPTGKGPCIQLPGAGRVGSRRVGCTLECRWGTPETCRAGVCGDGVVQLPETCDEGTLNGTYGHCLGGCTTLGPRCGDGVKQSNEACDCNESNGTYRFNGVVQSQSGSTCGGTMIVGVGVDSCSWDCSAAGPSCGDGAINGPEQCDGGFQEFKGFCQNDLLQTGCNANSDCNFGACLGTGSNKRCANNQSQTCSDNGDCQLTCGGYCPTTEQRNRRTCNPNVKADTGDDPLDANLGKVAEPAKACRWSNWVCTAPGSCGNGKKETGEECDDGNTDNTDGCIIDPVNNRNCKLARCADTYVSSTNLEQCDLGVENGTACLANYGLQCNYCTSACKTGTVSGGFCGNSSIEGASHKPPGPEECEGTQGMSNWICVSSKPEHQPIGVVAGVATCAANNCKRVCTYPDSELCFNDVGPLNNKDAVPVPAPNTNYSSVEAAPALYNSCDPDDDNDGVPEAATPRDCDDLAAWTHPAFTFSKPAGAAGCPAPSTPTQDGKCYVAAAPEVCDQVDNDCNAIVDDAVRLVQGTVMWAKNNNVKVANAKVVAYCGSAALADTTTNGSGYYQMNVPLKNCDKTQQPNLKIAVEPHPPDPFNYYYLLNKLPKPKFVPNEKSCTTNNMTDFPIYRDYANWRCFDTWCEPNNGAGGGEQDCGAIYSDNGEWDDGFCNQSSYGVCDNLNVAKFYSYTKWRANEPNSAGKDPNDPNSGEGCVEMYDNGEWNDLPCNGGNGYNNLRGLCADGTLTGPSTWEGAKIACAGKNGLFVIKDATDNGTALTKRNAAPAVDGVNSDIWIGLADKSNSADPKAYIWEDGAVAGDLTWDKAQSYCLQNSSRLAVIKDEAKNDLVKGACADAGTNYCWIGMNDRAAENDWVWTDCTTLDGSTPSCTPSCINPPLGCVCDQGVLVCIN